MKWNGLEAMYNFELFIENKPSLVYYHLSAILNITIVLS